MENNERLTAAKQKQIVNLLAGYGISFTKAGANEIKIICPHPDHKDTDASCYINTETNLFNCQGCGIGGSAIDFVVAVEGIGIKAAIDVLVGDSAPKKPAKTPIASKPKKAYQNMSQYKTAQYDYTDAKGNKLYASIRYDLPGGAKEFRMATYKNNSLITGISKDVKRVPYMLEEFADWQEVWFAEGEKCAEALTGLGIFCSCIAGGSKAKIDDIVAHFKDKDVVLLPDNDDTGRKFMREFSERLCGVAKSVRTLDVGTPKDPKGYDVYDKIQDLKLDGMTDAQAHKRLTTMKEASLYMLDGEPVYAINDRQRRAEYELMLTLDGFDLGDHLPAVKGKLRPFVAGDCIGISGGTASGKTSLLDALAKWFRPGNILTFNIELSTGVFYERELSSESSIPAREIEDMFRDGNPVDVGDSLSNVYTVPLSKVTPDTIRREFWKFVRLTGIWPDFVQMDYLQLMKGKGVRYEQTSDNAEEMRILGKELHTIIVFTSQKSRSSTSKKDGAKDITPTLGDAKGSGSIENSVSVYMDLRPHPDYADVKICAILKNTRGPAGFEFDIGWNGDCTKFIPGTVAQPDHAPDMFSNDPPDEIPDHSEPHNDDTF